MIKAGIALGNKETMANHGCINRTLDTANYSSPVPLVGLYIAAASFLCMLLMLSDIIAGFRSKTRWLPCKLFAVNSFSLSLLTIAAKIPVDLTTGMPNPEDQLSKLTGTGLICICMGFLMPSFGASTDSGIFSNLLSLSIFVTTIVINICTQIYTGVIVLFITEHIIMLCFMLLLLFMFWSIFLYTKNYNRFTMNQNKHLFVCGNSSMFERLKLCYLYGYSRNPQYEISTHPTYAAVSTICPMCSVVLIQATMRSLILKQLDFCVGISVYDWSMTIIVVTQILVVTVGTFAIVFRWIALFSSMEFEKIVVSFLDDDDTILKNQISKKRLMLHSLQNFFTPLTTKIFLLAQLLVVTPSVLLRYFLGLYKQDSLEYFEDLSHEGEITARGYMVREGVEDMIKLREVCNKESLNHLIQILTQTPHRHLCTMEIRDEAYPHQKGIEVCSLSLTFLVKVAQVSIPNNLLGSLVQAFSEAKEIIHFIEETILIKSLESHNKSSYAKALWTGGDFSSLLPDDNSIRIRTPDQLQSDLDRAIVIITELRDISPSSSIWSQLGVIIDFINRKSYSSIEELYTSMEQLFADMMHALLAQLPIAIFKNMIESPIEEYEARIRLSMKFLFQTGCLEDHIQWLFPGGPNFSRFVTEEDTNLRVLTGPLARFREVFPNGLDSQVGV